MQYAESVVDLVGNTPLVRLHLGDPRPGTRRPAGAGQGRVPQPGRLGEGPDRACAWSTPPRPAARCSPGGTIVEPTSGNTGIGLAMVAQQRGYKCIFVCPDKVGQEKINVLRAYGAEVVVCPTAVDPADPRSYYSVSDRLARETPGGWKPDQYSNPANPRVALRDDRAGDLGADRGPDHPLRHRHRAPAARSAASAATSRRSPAGRCRSSAPTPRARSTPAAPAGPTWSRASARTSGRPTYDRDDRRRDHRGLRRRLLRDDPAAGPRGGAARRRLLRAWPSSPRCGWPSS